ncbi:hypothetical protein P175DRAFT_0461729 [Aspergillus ochraceoroseus IBT 24754]|uniref:RhoGAP-domain-containing protein n=1 Tax=Aspergillus ochraceoroseus IBT 24754 TaxID=1392256 RepID=A0A2T5LSG5_9EURO|nr:uncharacterized protein P175DRAFT_0461729 [Aspergillus ochraceoroseus IBT 24754]PTU19216.1 hypothetical protein P175DRAFT_0461729 [Aspergillus ochraceoroseus IBT 24754]
MSQPRRQGNDHIFSSLPPSTAAAASPIALRPGGLALRSGSAVTDYSPRKPSLSPLHTDGRNQSPHRTDSSLSQRTASPISSTATSPLENLSTIRETAHAAFPTPLSTTGRISIDTSSNALRKRALSHNEMKMADQVNEIKTRKDSDATESTLSMSPSTMSPIGSLKSISGDRPVHHRTMPRTSSIDSAISSLSSASQSHKASFDANSISKADIDNLITAAGSPEAVIIHLLKEKHHAASQNSQLWRLVDKQRTLILGLNKDLERAMKEKERYKKKVKELQSAAPPLPSTEVQPVRPPTADSLDTTITQISPTNGPAKSPHPTDKPGAHPQRLQTGDSRSSPGSTPSLQKLVESVLLADEPDLRCESQSSQRLASIQEMSTTSPTSPVSPSSTIHDLASSGNKNPQVPHQIRKAPPAPLNLTPTDRTALEIPERSDSESEYEDILAVEESPIERGRRKTRDDDDREREAVLEREGSNALKNIEGSGTGPYAGLAIDPAPSDSRRAVPAEALSSTMSLRTLPSASIPERVIITGPKSPGLPLSPRPEDRPLGSPLPRMPREMPNSFSSLTMPSGNHLSGLALSPRVGKHPNPFVAGGHTVPSTPTHAGIPADSYNRRIPSIDAAVKIDSPQSPEHAAIGIYQGLKSEDYPNLLLPPNALPLIQVKVSSSRLRPSRNSYMAMKPLEEEPVFTLSVFSRSENSELWRVEKVIAALPQLDQHVRQLSAFQGKLPDRSIFSGHSPAKIDVRRAALNSYFEALLDTPMDEKAALVICQFLTSDAIEPRDDELSLLKGSHQAGSEILRGPDGKPRKEGYLTKRGKNFGGWKARFFVLHGPELKYFEAPGGAHLGTIKLHNAQIGKQSQNTCQSNPPSQADDDSDNQYRHAFLILEPKKKDSSALVRHVLCAESDEERDSWVEALLEYVEGSSENEASASRTPSQVSTKLPTNAAAKSKLFPNGSKKAGKGPDSPDLEISDTVQGFSYDDAVPAEPPVLGPFDRCTPRSPMFPPGSSIEDSHAASLDPAQISSKMISGPTNGAVIQDVGAWGNRTTSTREKKRSIWGFRTRSSIDLASQIQALSESPTIQIQGPSGEKRELVRPVFGIPLAEAVQYCAPQGANADLPAVVYRCIEYLKAKRAESEEGIFRLSGSNIVVKALRERFNTEGDVDFLAGDQYYDVHAVASLFKQYLRELPTTVLTRELHIEFLRVLELNEKQKKIVAFNSLVHRLPKPNLALLRALVQFLIIIVNNSDVNKMTVRNVGIVFAPTLNIPAPVFSMFLTEFDEIFEGTPGSNVDAMSLTVDHSLTPEDIRSPRRQMFSEIPTPAHHQMTFPRAGDRSDDYSAQHDTGFIPMQPSYEPYSHGTADNFPMAMPRMLAPNDNSRAAKAKRRESSMLFMEFNNENASAASHDDHA